MISRQALILLALVAAGCASEIRLLPSRAELESRTHNRRGLKALETGDREIALKEFEAARRLSLSIDDREGAALAELNRARLLRFANQTASSRLAGESALALLPPGSPLHAEAAFEKAKLAQATGNLRGAEDWARKALDLERGERLKSRLNLAARIAQQRGRPTEAEALSRKVLALDSKQEPEEMAHAYRLLAEILVATNRFVPAREAYLSALGLDRRLGKSRQIALDLRGLAGLAERATQPAEAIGYYQRALSVHLARSEKNLAARDQRDLGRLYLVLGQIDLAQNALALSQSYLNEAIHTDIDLMGGE